MRLNGKRIREIEKGQSGRVVVYMVSQFILQGISVISMPLFTRLLTTEQYGRFSLYSTWRAIVLLIVGFNVESSVSVAKVNFTEDKFKKFCSNTYFIVVANSLFWFILVGIFLGEFSGLLRMPENIVLFLLVHIFGLACTKIQSCIFLINKQAINDITLSISLSVLECVLSVCLIVFMKGNEDQARMLGMGIPYIILGSIFCVPYMKNIGNSLNKEMLKYILTLSIPMAFATLSSLILAQSDTIMILAISGEKQTGIYSFCYSVATPLTALLSALGRAWIPDYYANLKEKNVAWLKEHSDNYMFLFTCLTCGYLLVSREALKILGTKSYWDGIPILPPIILACYFQFLYTFPVNYEIYHKRTKMIGIVSAIPAILNIVLNLWLIPVLGMMGAAIATLCSYLILFLIHDVVVRNIGAYHYQWGFYLKGLCPVAMCCVITYVFSDSMGVRWSVGLIIAVLMIRRILKKRSLL